MKKIKTIAFCIIVSVFTSFAQQNIVDFEELPLEPESCWNGSDESGSFVSKYLEFFNEYDTEWDTWGGFSYTNQTDNTTYDWTNMYSSASGAGASGSENYAVAYYADFFEKPSIKINVETAPEIILGMYISLNAYTSLYMADSDYYQNENHLLKLIIKAYNSVLDYEIEKEIILADYRFQNTEGYKFDDWHYINMTWIEDSDSLVFWLESSDVGDWGINTPAYFCIDEINAAPPSTLPEFIVEICEDITIEQGEEAELLILAKGGMQPYFYEWNNAGTLNENSVQNPVATPETTTTYTVTVSDSHGNTEVKSVIVNVEVNYIAESVIFETSVYFDNSGLLNITGNQLINNLEIYDIQGRKIAETLVNSDKFVYNFGAITNSIYIIRLYSDYGVNNHKLILK